MKLYHHSSSNRGFKLIGLMFGIGLIALALAGVATSIVGEFLPWMALMSVAILGIPLGNYLVGKAAVADSKSRLSVTERDGLRLDSVSRVAGLRQSPDGGFPIRLASSNK